MASGKIPAAVEKMIFVGVALGLCFVLIPMFTTDDSRRLSDIRHVSAAIEAYRLAGKSYPPTPVASNCIASYNNVGNLSVYLVPLYLSEIPRDPKPRSCEYNYQYVASVDGSGYVLMANLTRIDPKIYSDRWCIGASSGIVPPYNQAYQPCPR
jgi:hypothetical protein